MNKKVKTAIVKRKSSKLVQPDAALLASIREIWESARLHAAKSVNTSLVLANWFIGEKIVEAEQSGEIRARYGERILGTLSKKLSVEFGNGFSLTALKYMRLFYLTYPNLAPIGHSVRGQLQNTVNGSKYEIGHALSDQSSNWKNAKWIPGLLHSGLSWTHYRNLLKVDQQEARDFYEIEAMHNGWSARQLERQINSQLFFRLVKSRDKKGVLALANKGQQVINPIDAIKDPYVLEFLELPESHRLVESKVEEAILSRLQEFLLELGSGFAFIGRQRRITLEGDHFYPDLVFYHARLKCYVIIDLKTDKLTHGDLGQMQLYVNYYDREIINPDDNPTLGLILCTDKNDALARYVLDKNNKQIFASSYKMHLPSEKKLQQEIRREMRELGVPTASNKKGRKS